MTGVVLADEHDLPPSAGPPQESSMAYPLHRPDGVVPASPHLPSLEREVLDY